MKSVRRQDIESSTKSRTHEEITQFHKMTNISHLFSKYIGQVDFAIDMLNNNKVGKDGFPNPVLFHLNMSQTLGGSTFGPIDTGHVIIIHCIG